MSEPTTPKDRANRPALLIVFLVVVIDLLGFGIVLPLLPRYAEDYIEPVVPGGKPQPGSAGSSSAC